MHTVGSPEKVIVYRMFWHPSAVTCCVVVGMLIVSSCDTWLLESFIHFLVLALTQSQPQASIFVCVCDLIRCKWFGTGTLLVRA